MPKGKVHKITAAKQKDIVQRYRNGMSVPEICARYRVAESSVRFWTGKYTDRKTPYKFVPAKKYNDLSSHLEKAEEISRIREKFIAGLNMTLKDKYAFMDDFYDHYIYGGSAETPEYGIRRLCEAMMVDRITYKHHLEKRDSYREEEHRESMLKDRINGLYASSKGMLGADQIKVLLEREGVRISVSHVRALMREMNIGHTRMTQSLRQRLFYYPEQKCNLLLKENRITGINQLWVSDFKEFGYHGHRYYVCMVIDTYSRRALAAYIRENKGKYLAAATLRSAIEHRGAAPKIFHTDGGGEYDARNMRQIYREYGIRHSFSRPGVPDDNPFIESFFNLFSSRFLYAGEYFQSAEELARKFSGFIDYYNTLIRRNLNYCSPIEYEEKFPNETLYIYPGKTKNNRATFRLSWAREQLSEEESLDIIGDADTEKFDFREQE